MQSSKIMSMPCIFFLHSSCYVHLINDLSLPLDEAGGRGNWVAVSDVKEALANT